MCRMILLEKYCADVRFLLDHEAKTLTLQGWDVSVC